MANEAVKDSGVVGCGTGQSRTSRTPKINSSDHLISSIQRELAILTAFLSVLRDSVVRNRWLIAVPAKAHFLSYTVLLVIFFPFGPVRIVVTVRDFPSGSITMCPVTVV